MLINSIAFHHWLNILNNVPKYCCWSGNLNKNIPRVIYNFDELSTRASGIYKLNVLQVSSAWTFYSYKLYQCIIGLSNTHTNHLMFKSVYYGHGIHTKLSTAYRFLLTYAACQPGFDGVHYGMQMFHSQQSSKSQIV